MSLHAGQVLLAPIVSEKSYAMVADRKYTFKVHPDAHKTQIRQAVEELFEVRVLHVNVVAMKAKPKGRKSDGTPSLQADERRPPLYDGLGVRGDHEVEAGEEPARAGDEEGRPQQLGPHHDAPPGRRPQAPLPDHRLQAPQGR